MIQKPTYKGKGYNVYVGDCRSTLQTFPEKSVQCCITSPPYYGLRDYGIKGQIGLEKYAQRYVKNLVRAFRELHRVLKDDGTLFLNLGDTYASYKDGKFPPQSKNKDLRGLPQVAPHRSPKLLRESGFKDKELMGIPWRVAFALQRDGWYLRQDIIWNKQNYTPEKVRDRFVKSHEYIFLLTKNKNYKLDGDKVRIPAREGSKLRTSVWDYSTSKYKGNHFATFPPELIAPCIEAATDPGDIIIDIFGGTGTTAGQAIAMRRKALILELNPEFAESAPNRIQTIVERYG